MEKKVAKERIVFLSGKKVDLVIIEKEDMPKITKWVNNQEVTQFITMFAPMSQKLEEDWFERISTSDREIVLSIATKDGKLIGNTGLHAINWKDRNATHGIVIGDKKYWSGGYGTDTGMTLFKYAFESLGLHKINSSAIGYNKRSLAYHFKCGFKEAGRLKQQIFKKGKFHDQILLDLFPEDFEEVWKKYDSSQ